MFLFKTASGVTVCRYNIITIVCFSHFSIVAYQVSRNFILAPQSVTIKYIYTLQQPIRLQDFEQGNDKSYSQMATVQ